MKLGLVISCVLYALPLAAQSKVPADHAAKIKEGTDLFKSHIRPILTQHCLDCHGGKSVKADFDLSSYESLKASETIEADLDKSRFFLVITHREQPFMPHKQPKLSAESIALLVKWAKLGYPYDRPLVDKKVAVQEMKITDVERQYWAFKPLARALPPAVKDAAWPTNDIDRFLLNAMEQKKLTPARDADKRTLIRRVAFDLIGLPPDADDVEAFASGKVGFETVVDRLLASPHFGERWARHWLDPARFGESNGFEHDLFRPTAYHYRDFVIKAMNADMPYDQFVRWQIAGDELAPESALAVSATGFLGAGVFPTQITTREAERVRYDAMDDMLSTTGHAILGLTVGCARCHDHKFDPIPARDYYRMLAAFTTTVRSEVEMDIGTEAQKKATSDHDAKLQPLLDRRKKLEDVDLPKRFAQRIDEARTRLLELPATSDAKLRDLLNKLTAGQLAVAKLDKGQRAQALAWFKSIDEEWKANEKQIAELNKTKPKDNRVKILTCTEGLKPVRLFTADASIPDFYPQTFQLKRGDVEQKDGPATPGYLEVLTRHPKGSDHWTMSPPKGSRTSFRRTGLANWMTDVEHGAGHLTARVIVNRLWHHHFGRGLVATVNDFGLQGDPPTHPELLDWLANDLIQGGWTLKRMHRQIVLSHAYRLAAGRSPADPDNRWLTHRTRKRLEAEIIRDNLLAVGGKLDATQFGPGSLDENMKRRSVYFTVQRSKMIPSLQVFDWPDTLTSAPARTSTVIAPQALLFLNNPLVHECAKGFAARLEPFAKESPDRAVEQAFRIAFSRPPSAGELKEGAAFFREGTLADYALVLMSLNEFIYVD